MKVFLISLFISFSFSGHTLVKINKGPAFHIFRIHRAVMDQRALLASYIGWNSFHDSANQGLATSINAKFLLNKKNKKSFSPLDINKNYLIFGYKTEDGRYFSWNFVQTRYGYCHGMVIVQRQLLYYAHFKPNVKAPYSRTKNPKRWLQYYKDIIDDVMEGKPRDIPGFSNIQEFSSSPVQIYLQRHVADQWGINTASMDMLANVSQYTFRPLTSKDVQRYRNKISKYLSLNFYPRVILGLPSYMVRNPHVVLITGLSKNKETEECIEFHGYSPGANSSNFRSYKYCVGSYLWIPPEENDYFKDFSNTL